MMRYTPKSALVNAHTASLNFFISPGQADSPAVGTTWNPRYAPWCCTRKSRHYGMQCSQSRCAAVASRGVSGKWPLQLSPRRRPAFHYQRKVDSKCSVSAPRHDLPQGAVEGFSDQHK